MLGESICMRPSDMNLNIKLGDVGYNNKFSYPIVSLVWEKNNKVYTSAPSNKASIIPKHTPKTSIIHAL